MGRLARRLRGVTLVELVMFIVLVGIAFSALLLAISSFTRHSADPLLQKQALAIAESLLDEIELMQFTYCDPDDANASTATSSAGCATLAEALGPETQSGTPETRYSSSVPFDNVNDYNGFSMTGIRAIYDAATIIPGLASYKAEVTVAPAALGGITSGSGDVLQVTVKVTLPDSSTLTLDGFRARYAPNTSQ